MNNRDREREKDQFEVTPHVPETHERAQEELVIGRK